ncbi:MAG TPA: hypothetical protein VF092_15695 [Longimicrobium sp.]
MRHAMNARRAIPRIAGLALLALQAACVTWMERPAPRPRAAASLPARVRVTRMDRTSMVLIDPFVRGDSLHGTRVDPPVQDVAVALDDVLRVEARRVNVAATAGAVALAWLAAYGIRLVCPFCNGGA